MPTFSRSVIGVIGCNRGDGKRLIEWTGKSVSPLTLTIGISNTLILLSRSSIPHHGVLLELLL